MDAADALVARAVAAGGLLGRAPEEHFFGERSAPCAIPSGTDG